MNHEPCSPEQSRTELGLREAEKCVPPLLALYRYPQQCLLMAQMSHLDNAAIHGNRNFPRTEPLHPEGWDGHGRSPYPDFAAEKTKMQKRERTHPRSPWEVEAQPRVG